jgi:uncharacterized membrane protein (UPF0182 family)
MIDRLRTPVVPTGADRHRRRLVIGVVVALAALAIGGSTLASYYVDALWFGSLGYGAVFWTTLSIEAVAFGSFGLVTFGVLYGAFRLFRPPRLDGSNGFAILINRQRVVLPIDSVVRRLATGLFVLIAYATAASMMGRWSVFALFFHAPPAAAPVDPVFGHTLGFYLFTLPALQLVSSWLLTLSILVGMVAAFFALASGGLGVLRNGADESRLRLWRGISIAFAGFLLALALRNYVGRFETLFESGTVFTGVNYTNDHVTLAGKLLVSVALVGAAIAIAFGATQAPQPRRLLIAIAPAIVCHVLTLLVGGYVSSFIVKPNELVRERPYIRSNIEFTRRAYALDRIEPRPFPAETGIEAVDAAHNRLTLDNIRLWDSRALQDTLRQIQEIRTYYDFPDIDIDRYTVDGTVRQMMLATRELNVTKLPESSRNWINERLIYTHGYGVTMNPVNGFTAEGLPTLVLSNMPIQTTLPQLTVKRPEIYFGEVTDTDVYVKTRQKEFNYPQGDSNNLTSYEGEGGIALGGPFRRTLIAWARDDLGKLPFSDDVGPQSRLLMRRNVRDRVRALAPFLTIDADPYIVVGDDGHLYWLMDAFTTAQTYPYARRAVVDGAELNYIRNSVKVRIDAYSGATTFYVFDPEDPVLAGYRAVFPTLFVDAATMPAWLRAHVRYPELLLKVQAALYGLYHMTNPDVFYNREDLWSVAAEPGSQNQRDGVAQPNFVLMTLPGESAAEFIGILPFTPANRNNLIGWIAGRSDGAHYGQAVVYDFPKSKLIDGPQQIEARIDQNAQLSGQLTLWSQHGSHVHRGNLIVIPVGRALLYAEPIYLQAERSPMPELRLVVLAVQDKLAYGPTFETALEALFTGAPSMLSAAPAAATATAPSAPSAPTAADQASPAAGDTHALIAAAARDLADYQTLTAAGRLGEAGRKLEDLKRTLESLERRPESGGAAGEAHKRP